MLIRGKINAAVIIAPGFAGDLQAMKGIPLQLIIDGTEPESGQYAVEHISQRVEEFINSALTVQLRAQGIPITSLQILDLRIQTWYNPDLKPRNVLIPGLISMVLGFPALSVALTLAHEREHGTLEQLIATPIGRAELLIGKTIPYILVGLINVILIPMLSIAWFHISLNGSFILFFVLSAIFMFEVLSMGLIVGVFMRTQAAALGTIVSGVVFPRLFPDRHLLPPGFDAGGGAHAGDVPAGHALRYHHARDFFAGRGHGRALAVRSNDGDHGCGFHRGGVVVLPQETGMTPDPTLSFGERKMDMKW